MSCVYINNNNNIVHVFIPFVYSLVSCILLFVHVYFCYKKIIIKKKNKKKQIHFEKIILNNNNNNKIYYNNTAAYAAECRKHVANDAKCLELGWTCIPLRWRSLGTGERRLRLFFPRLGSLIAIHQASPKSCVQ